MSMRLVSLDARPLIRARDQLKIRMQRLVRFELRRTSVDRCLQCCVLYPQLGNHQSVRARRRAVGASHLLPGVQH